LKKLLCRMLPIAFGLIAVGVGMLYASTASPTAAASRIWIDQYGQPVLSN
jgi:hypothetical protein